MQLNICKVWVLNQLPKIFLKFSKNIPYKIAKFYKVDLTEDFILTQLQSSLKLQSLLMKIITVKNSKYQIK